MASELSKKYKHLTVVTFADKVGEYEQQLKEHNGTMYQFDTIKVISAGDIDPDSNTVSVVSNVKMCESAKTGNFTQFKKGVPHTLTELDSRRLMNDLRKGMGLDPIRENVIFERTKIREQYVAGKIFNVGDRVKDEDGVYEIMDRGANYITVVNESGNLMKKWIDKVSPSRKKIEENLDTNPNEISFKNYTTTNFHKDPRVFHAFKGTISKWEQGGIEDGVAVLNAIKHTDSYLSMTDGKDRTSEADKAKQALARVGEHQSHNYWDDHKVITTADVVAKHNADLQNAISKMNVKEETEVMDSKKIAVRYKDFLKKSGSKEKAIDIAEPSSGKPMTVFKNKEGKLKVQDQEDPSELPEHIEKVKGGYEVESEHGNKNLGKYNSMAGAKKRLKQIEYFKHMKEEHDDQYEMATGFKAAAEHSLSKGNKGAYHAHMANHHDHMGQWHERKNRTSSADREYEKAEFHHAETMKHPYIAEDTIVETFSSVKHESDHKHITHGADFGFKVGKEHHAKISNLEHGDRHVFKCMDNNEYGCWRNGDNLHFKRHSHDGGIQTNMSTIIPVPMWNNQDAMGQDKPVSEETIFESAPFKDLKSAVHYASEKVKTHRDHEDGIEVYKHKAGGYDVNHTMNANGRNALHGSGAKHLGTVYRDKQFNIKHNIKEDLDEAHKLGDKVIMTKGPKDVVGKVGHVGEIRKRWTGDTNTYTIDHEGGSIQLKPTHFKKFKEEAEQIDELSTDLLGKYKTAAHANAKASDAAGNYKKGDKRFAGINKATRKQFDNDLKKHGQFKEDIYSSDTKTKKVQVQDKDGNWVFKDRKFHPKKINFAASKMNGKPAQPDDPTKVDTETAYQNHLDKQAKLRANEAWVLNPDGKTKKKYKDIKDNKTLSISNTAPFDAFSNTNNQT
jgi:hypothetical protein